MPPVLCDNGLVSSQDASTAPAGSLVRADDCYYKPNNPALWKALGRSAFNSSALSGSIKGARVLIYDGAADVIVVHVGTSYWEATLAATGTFSEVVTGLTGGLTLDSVHYNNEHVLLNGVDRGRVRNSAGVWSLLGMLANTSAPTGALGGTGFTLTAGSTIKYWVEERVKSVSTVVKRSASTTAEVLTLTGPVTDDSYTVTRPATVNSDATHWALFATATGGSFPIGAEIGEVAIGTTTIVDARTGTDPGLPSGTAYEYISVSLAGVIFNAAKNGQPPIMATADTMEDSLFGPDATDKSIFRFTVEDNIHAWPSVNKFRIGDTKEEDEGVALRFVGDIGIALLRDSAWRVPALPRQVDSAFQPERGKKQTEGAIGCVGPMACDLFSLGEGSRLAYVSTAGLMITDGYDWDSVGDHLDWPATFALASLSSAVLANDPVNFRLEMVAQNPAGVFVQYYFSYHRSHLKQKPGGGLAFKVTGPIHMTATCKARGSLSGVRRIFSGHTNGKLYLDGGQTADAADNALAMYVETRDEYHAGIGQRAQVESLYVHHQAGTAAQTATVTLIQKNHGEDDVATPVSMSLARREATRTGLTGFAEAYRYRFQNSDTIGPVSLDYFVPQVQDATLAKGK